MTVFNQQELEFGPPSGVCQCGYGESDRIGRGGMLSGEGRARMPDAPWMVLWPGPALSVAEFGINMFGDALRDVLDPRLRAVWDVMQGEGGR